MPTLRIPSGGLGNAEAKSCRDGRERMCNSTEARSYRTGISAYLAMDDVRQSKPEAEFKTTVIITSTLTFILFCKVFKDRAAYILCNPTKAYRCCTEDNSALPSCFPRLLVPCSDPSDQRACANFEPVRSSSTA
jgi:hypothetical protein